MGTKRTRASNPAIWGLTGVLAGSLVSGAFSVRAAEIASQATENSAARAQESSERSIQAENKRARDEFLREQRVAIYKQFLTDSQVYEQAQSDFLEVLRFRDSYPPDSPDAYLSDLETKHRQFINSSWGFEFFSTKELRDHATAIVQELHETYNMLPFPSEAKDAAHLNTLRRRLDLGRDIMAQQRQKFTEVAGRILAD